MARIRYTSSSVGQIKDKPAHPPSCFVRSYLEYNRAKSLVESNYLDLFVWVFFLLNSLKIENHRMGQVEREHRGSYGPTSLFKQGHPGAHGTGLHPDGS